MLDIDGDSLVVTKVSHPSVASTAGDYNRNNHRLPSLRKHRAHPFRNFLEACTSPMYVLLNAPPLRVRVRHAPGIRIGDRLVGLNSRPIDFQSLHAVQTFADSVFGTVHFLRPCALIVAHVKRAQLAQGFEPLQVTLTSQEDRVAGRTHRVSQIKTGGPAHRAGVQIGDVISKINGVTVNGLQHWEVLKLLGGVGTFTMILGRVDTSDLAQVTMPQTSQERREGFICPVCRTDFASDIALKEHFVTAHLIDNPPPASAGNGGYHGTPGGVQKQDIRADPQSEPPKRRLKQHLEAQTFSTPQPAAPKRFCTMCGCSLIGMSPAEVQKHYATHGHGHSARGK